MVAGSPRAPPQAARSLRPEPALLITTERSSAKATSRARLAKHSITSLSLSTPLAAGQTTSSRRPSTSQLPTTPTLRWRGGW